MSINSSEYRIAIKSLQGALSAAGLPGLVITANSATLTGTRIEGAREIGKELDKRVEAYYDEMP